MSISHHQLRVDPSQRPVSAVLCRPADAGWGLVLAHGAGAGMHHHFMESLVEALAERRVATLRYQFPYMEQGRRRPDAKPLLLASVRAAVHLAGTLLEGLPLFAGGKSMGGRMTSLAASAEPLAGVSGLVFYGFPLHPAGRSGTQRGDHLRSLDVPTLFLQGSRDKLADLDLLRPVVEQLEQADLRVIDGADHSFQVLKRSGRTAEEVLAELADASRRWFEQRAPSPPAP